MNLQQRLAKLEEKTTQDQPAVVWMNPGETQEEACQRVGLRRRSAFPSIFVSWLEVRGE
jgi:hypothetical protein